MLAFSQQPMHNSSMPAVKQPPYSLSIQIVPYGDDATLTINTKVYLLYTPVLKTLDDLVRLLQEGGEPEYIIYAVISMLKEMVK